MPTRPYVSPRRTAAADDKRRQVLEAATHLLATEDVSKFSLDAVARHAGVTRLTVYHQFGSRRGLLEHVFDELARRGGLDRIPDSIENQDAYTALNSMVSLFCTFWSSEPAVGRLNDAVGIDPEFGSALIERNERRRDAAKALLRRLPQRITESRVTDAADVIFAMTSYPMFRMLTVGRSPDAAADLIKTACRDAIRRALNDGSGENDGSVVDGSDHATTVSIIQGRRRRAHRQS